MLFDLECYTCEITYDPALIVREFEVHSSPSPYACPQAFMHGRTREADLFRGGVTSQLQLVAVMTTAQADPLSLDPLRQYSPPEKLHLRFRLHRQKPCRTSVRNVQRHPSTRCMLDSSPVRCDPRTHNRGILSSILARRTVC